MRATAYGNGGGDRTYVSKLSPEWYKIINVNIFTLWWKRILPKSYHQTTKNARSRSTMGKL